MRAAAIASIASPIICKYITYLRFLMYSWDESKRLKNLRKHRIDFRDVPRVFGGFTITSQDDRDVYGERRYLTIGYLKEQVVTLAHCDCGDEIRIISMRKATKRETRFYFSQIPY